MNFIYMEVTKIGGHRLPAFLAFAFAAQTAYRLLTLFSKYQQLAGLTGFWPFKLFTCLIQFALD